MVWESQIYRWHLNRKNRYDWPLDVCTSGEEYVVNFLNGRVEALNKPYKENTNYRPVNRIFGANEKDCMDPTVYPSIIFQLYASTYGPGAETLKKEWKPSRLGLSEFSHEKSWYVSEAEVVDIIKEEGKRLYGKSADNANQNLPGIESVSSGMRDRLRDSKGRFRAA